MSWFFKDVKFNETEEGSAKIEGESPADGLHDDFDQMDEMMMGQSNKVPHFRQITHPVKMLCVKKANIIRGCRISWGTPFTPGFTLTHTWNLLPERVPSPMNRRKMMGAMSPDQKASHYALQAQYAHIDPTNPQEADFVIFANMESNGKLQTVFGKNITSWIHTR